MIKRSFLIVLVAVFGLTSTLRANEGMWLLSLIGKNYQDMKAQGFRLTPEDIYNVNRSSLKDAIVGLGTEENPFWHFCTAEIISGEGLISTNHHCGFDMIQKHSTVEHDYLQDGFWAYQKSQELPNEGITAQVLYRIEDVTDKVMSKLDDKMDEYRRQEIADSIGKIIAQEAKKGTNYDAQVVDLFKSNQYFLFIYTTYKDVRMVGAPPQSMGKFGGDTDNWSYPRHTADFSLFRIYAGKDNNPAKYSAENVPLKPKHFLPVSIKGINEGDFAMIMGFPGTTNRFLTSYGLDETMNITNDLRYKIRTVKIDVLREKMAESQETRIKYASKYASCSNYWKYSNEQNKALQKLNTKKQKQEIEARYMAWARQQKDGKYVAALDLLQKGYEARKNAQTATMYISEGILRGPELFYFAIDVFSKMLDLGEEKDKAKAQAMSDDLKKFIDDFYKDYDQATERALIANMVGYTYKNMPAEHQPDYLKNIVGKKFKGDGEKYADFIMKKSVFSSKDKLMTALDKKGSKSVMSDPAVAMAYFAIEKAKELAKGVVDANKNIARGNRYFVDGLLQINGDKPIAPDANSTIRLTYGNVKGYAPRDGVKYNFYTTLDGVIEKENPNSSEFIVEEKLKELHAKKDYGIYANSKGELPACFLTDNDITGGNSGSPVIDADGNLIGLAFDGNGEAMSGDIDFEENLQRCINLDVRYMLFIIDKFAGAKNLIQEMKIVK